MNLKLIKNKIIDFSREVNQINDDIQKNLYNMPLKQMKRKSEKIQDLTLRVKLLAEIYNKYKS